MKMIKKNWDILDGFECIGDIRKMQKMSMIDAETNMQQREASNEICRIKIRSG